MRAITLASLRSPLRRCRPPPSPIPAMAMPPASSMASCTRSCGLDHLLCMVAVGVFAYRARRQGALAGAAELCRHDGRRLSDRRGRARTALRRTGHRAQRHRHRRRCRFRPLAAGWRRDGAGRALCHLSRPRPRRRNAGERQRPRLCAGLCRRHPAAAPRRYRRRARRCQTRRPLRPPARPAGRRGVRARRHRALAGWL